MKNKLSKFIGLLIAFFVSGSAHFIAGEKKKGLSWYLGLMVLSGLATIVLCSPGVVSFAITVILLLAYLILWFVMLKQSFRPMPKIKLWQWGLLILVWFSTNLTNSISKKYVCEAFRFPGTSMQPTLLQNDLIIVNKLIYKFASPKKGDLIAFRQDGTVHVKRISNLPDEKRIMISGESIELGADEYFVLGDNCINSKDSRYFGPVQKSNIVGKVVRIYWPMNRINKL